MKYPDLLRGVFLERLNRFAVRVKIGRRSEIALLPNSGRLAELLVAGAPVRLIPVDKPTRKTRFDLALIRYAGRWVSVNAHLANDLFDEAIGRGSMAPFEGWSVKRREVTYGRSRLDFLLAQGDRRMFVEVKSVTLVVGNEARFPDAPTSRGVKHLKELTALARQGRPAAVVFVIQRSDAERFASNRTKDPEFAEALRVAQQEGVVASAYRCGVGEKTIRIGLQLPVVLRERGGCRDSLP